MDLETLKEEIRARADVVDIIGRVVKLRKAGGTYKGLCPFHQEKSPSFTVNTSRQTYHCFGCDAGGDVFKFIMEYEHLDFMGALERLANQVGVPFEFDGAKGDRSLRKRLLEIHEKTTAYYEEQLHTIPAAKAYLEKRALAEETPEAFRLGYAPKSFETLLKLTREWGFTDTEIEASGIMGVRDTPKQGERMYDRFRNRLMFPIFDEQSRVIGFSGRVVPPDDSKAKYLNSPETLLFKKSRVLYGIDKARKSMAERRRAILCEGQLDVIRCHEAGLTEAVASQGTAITEEHAIILKRYADEVILLLDADAAGVKAALRSSEALLSVGLSAKVASLPEGEDPDDLVRIHGPKRLREVVEASDPFVVFQVRSLVRQEGEINETSRLRVARAVMETISQASEAVHREELIRQAAGALGMREEALRQDLKPATRRAQSARPSRPAPSHPRPPSPETPRQAGDFLPPPVKFLLELLMLYPPGIKKAKAHLTPTHLDNEQAAAMLDILYQAAPQTEEGIHDAAREHEAGNSLIGLAQQSSLKLGDEFGTPEETVMELVLTLRQQALTRQKLEQQAQAAHAAGDRKLALEADIWRFTMHQRQLKEFTKLKQWDKAAMLLDMIDMQNDSEA